MQEQNIHKMILEQCIRRLFTVSRQINLSFLNSEEDDLNIKSLKSDIQMIKGLAINIEIEMDNI